MSFYNLHHLHKIVRIHFNIFYPQIWKISFATDNICFHNFIRPPQNLPTLYFLCQNIQVSVFNHTHNHTVSNFITHCQCKDVESKFRLKVLVIWRLLSPQKRYLLLKTKGTHFKWFFLKILDLPAHKTKYYLKTYFLCQNQDELFSIQFGIYYCVVYTFSKLFEMKILTILRIEYCRNALK